MESSIYLIRGVNQKVVPALCLKDSNDYFIFAQLRQANQEDIFNTQDTKTMEKFNRGKPDREQIKIRKKYEVDTIYIGQPEGLNSKSVVMVKKLHKVSKSQLIKKIAEVDYDFVLKCKELIKQVKEIARLQKELQQLKRKLQLATINNEKYSHYEKRIGEVLKAIGYKSGKKRKNKPYENLREVPNKGYIKIYYGGR
ncbi:hypothetical protein [Salirhabdus salicampi]|uniref:hypothetical protein n=1 Tax=Salirhabdus salicampi TaxID=476102 RepID=UPI0020C1C627|nr:hypothetical protein [Salirhabdus salicampi]MCP8615235.1 hypothetical protein [Salirhabdus salicampi]